MGPKLNIRAFKNAISEAGRIFTELAKLGTKEIIWIWVVVWVSTMMVLVRL